ncbi:MAG: hypothetical protein AAGD25_18625, partial [Cyanobacteria bacterium P01_F01_bin.150]
VFSNYLVWTLFFEGEWQTPVWLKTFCIFFLWYWGLSLFAGGCGRLAPTLPLILVRLKTKPVLVLKLKHRRDVYR